MKMKRPHKVNIRQADNYHQKIRYTCWYECHCHKQSVWSVIDWALSKFTGIKIFGVSARFMYECHCHNLCGCDLLPNLGCIWPSCRRQKICVAVCWTIHCQCNLNGRTRNLATWDPYAAVLEELVPRFGKCLVGNTICYKLYNDYIYW